MKLADNELYDVICSIEQFKTKMPVVIKDIDELTSKCVLLMKEMNNLKENHSNSKIIMAQLQKNIDEMNRKIELLNEMCNKNTDYNNSTESKIKMTLFILSVVFGLYTAGAISLNIIG